MARSASKQKAPAGPLTVSATEPLLRLAPKWRRLPMTTTLPLLDRTADSMLLALVLLVLVLLERRTGERHGIG